MLADLLQRHDRDRFACSLFAPAAARPALWALLAFNYEIGRVREVVTQPLLGQIRLQWWRDALEEIATRKVPRSHFVVQRLAEAMADHAMDRRLLDGMIDAREGMDLAEVPPATLEALEQYAAATSGALLQAELQILGGGTPSRPSSTSGGGLCLPLPPERWRVGVGVPSTDSYDQTAAANHLGIAWALIGVVRAAPFHASAGRRYIPAELLDPQTPVDFAGPVVRASLKTIARRAAHHLELARAARPQVPRSALPVMILARAAAHYLAALRRLDYDPRELAGSGGHAAGAAGMLWGSITGRY